VVTLPGVAFRLDGERLVADSARPLTDDDRKFIVDHKAQLIAELMRQRRREAVLAMLADNPDINYAYSVDDTNDPVIVACAVRGIATCELSIPAARYDAARFLAFIDGERES
jgi:hypothetical protein